MADKNVLGRCDSVCIIMCENNCIKWEVVDEPRMAKNNVLERCDLLCVKVCGQPCPSHVLIMNFFPVDSDCSVKILQSMECLLSITGSLGYVSCQKKVLGRCNTVCIIMCESNS